MIQEWAFISNNNKYVQQWLCEIWKWSLLVINPQRLCCSPQLCRVSWHVIAHCFGLIPLTFNLLVHSQCCDQLQFSCFRLKRLIKPTVCHLLSTEQQATSATGLSTQILAARESDELVEAKTERKEDWILDLDLIRDQEHDSERMLLLLRVCWMYI